MSTSLSDFLFNSQEGRPSELQADAELLPKSAVLVLLAKDGSCLFKRRPSSRSEPLYDVLLHVDLTDKTDAKHEVETTYMHAYPKLSDLAPIQDIKFASVLTIDRLLAESNSQAEDEKSFVWVFFLIAEHPAELVLSAVVDQESSSCSPSSREANDTIISLENHNTKNSVQNRNDNSSASPIFQFANQNDMRHRYYLKQCAPTLSAVVRTFDPVLQTLTKLEKQFVPATNWDMQDLIDYHVLQPCYYIFDKPGKGVRSRSLRALGDVFSIHPQDLESLMHYIDRVHELSLIVDDIEDDSEMRRDRECAHVRFGTPSSINSAYFMMYKLIQNIPHTFRGHHYETLKYVLDASVNIHRGQGLEIHWRDTGYCPTVREYIEMVKGKTSTPFVLATQLFFLHSTDLRLKLSNSLTQIGNWLLGLVQWSSVLKTPSSRTVAEQVIELFDITGIFFQIRDDYINLVDPKYWMTKGFCDDIHERKYSFPIIYLLQHRLQGYRTIAEMYRSTTPLTHSDICKALSLIRDTSTLNYTYDYLVEMRTRLEQHALSLGFEGYIKLLDQLQFPDPHVSANPDTWPKE